jgi:hypothetical protein
LAATITVHALIRTAAAAGSRVIRASMARAEIPLGTGQEPILELVILRLALTRHPLLLLIEMVLITPIVVVPTPLEAQAAIPGVSAIIDPAIPPAPSTTVTSQAGASCLSRAATPPVGTGRAPHRPPGEE